MGIVSPAANAALPKAIPEVLSDVAAGPPLEGAAQASTRTIVEQTNRIDDVMIPPPNSD
jgi:hypothetical protein